MECFGLYSGILYANIIQKAKANSIDIRDKTDFPTIKGKNVLLEITKGVTKHILKDKRISPNKIYSQESYFSLTIAILIPYLIKFNSEIISNIYSTI